LLRVDLGRRSEVGAKVERCREVVRFGRDM
jgi:hypothetical protein